MGHENLTKARRGPHITPDDFLIDAQKYFQWCIDHPLLEEHVFQYKGAIIRADKSKVRAFTKTGLNAFLALPASRLESYRERGGEWAEAVEMVENVIYSQKFENAAGNLLNAGFIARDLGLTDKSEVKTASVVVNIEGDDARL